MKKIDIPLIEIIPWEHMCQEANSLSVDRYIPCATPAVAIVYHRKDRRGYYMCMNCTVHNLKNRGGYLVSAKNLATYNELLLEERN
jgi:hypothetical protein